MSVDPGTGGSGYRPGTRKAGDQYRAEIRRPNGTVCAHTGYSFDERADALADARARLAAVNEEEKHSYWKVYP